MGFLNKLLRKKTQEEKDALKPAEYPPIGTNWSNWKIWVETSDENAVEMTPDFYTRLGRSGIKIDDEKYYTVDEILNLRFGNQAMSVQREKKAFAIAALFSIVVADKTHEILHIGKDQRNRFWHPRDKKARRVQWIKSNGEEFDLQEALCNFFAEQNNNLGAEDAKLFSYEENEFIVRILGETVY
ncbi:Oidioi.mRNA.OKI2018_I69.chr1.g282.t1.cds [Oikopleura dioica]|uniref:Oidioi.mRNA.OKI2018_I69.chr1.g282.t1.cds n=1 Tax=Oikopleura dioica TaxID=34765 RepID=A0ABN7SJC9_OIKDI|nr:Oidioi.mRNA.OKI2018_I69.chr1.g282.t1.cds [Oikopleura dioica]